MADKQYKRKYYDREDEQPDMVLSSNSTSSFIFGTSKLEIRNGTEVRIYDEILTCPFCNHNIEDYLREKK